MELREYQREGIEQIESNFAAGVSHQVLCMPTGAGKTYTFAALSKEYLARNQKVMILTDRKELLSQTCMSFLHVGVNAQLITAKDKHIKRADIYVAMVETLYRRLNSLKNRMAMTHGGDIDLIIIDECHKGNFRKVLNHDFFKAAKVLGVTATPLTHSKKHPLKESFGTIVEPITLPELIEQGALVPCKTYGAIEDVKLKKDTTGEYTDASQMEYFDKSVGYDGVIKEYREHAEGTKALVFCVNKEHTRDTFAAFQRAGYRASWVLSGEDCNRERTLKTFRETNDIQVLCNCGILTTGYDNPSIETIILNRGTASLPLYFQMTGRGSRPYTDKNHFKIIDMFSNFKQHGQWDSDRDWVGIFKNPPEPGKAPMKKCPKCKGEVPASTRFCPLCVGDKDEPGLIVVCGYEFPEVEAEEKELATSEGFVEVPKELFQPAKPIYAMDVKELAEYAGKKGYQKMWVFHQVRRKGRDAVKEWAKSAGYKPGFVWHQEKTRKENLWKDVKAFYGNESMSVGKRIKERIDNDFDGDFFFAEPHLRRELYLAGLLVSP